MAIKQSALQRNLDFMLVFLCKADCVYFQNAGFFFNEHWHNIRSILMHQTALTHGKQ